ncbi:MAG: DUF3576 domain-containing protein [Alphaproteobacteria bacterium]|nr:DUF3576 domain-containing protein [Alphaproteobacteria bacterium]
MKNSSLTASFRYFLVKKSALAVLLCCTFLTLNGCSGDGLHSEAKYEDRNVRSEMYKNGSLVSDEGGFSLLGDRTAKAKDQNGLGVNGYLWRATLDTVSFMPIASADPFGGVITTDWYAAPDAPNERAKLNVFILDRDLRADGVKVTVFRQTKTVNGEWTDAPVSAATSSQLEETILTRARQLKLAQRDSD